jgi:DNA topoisomerase I
MRNLIVAEKPSVALRIALSLSDGRPLRKNINGIGYYEFLNEGNTILVVAAAGHLFTVSQKGPSRTIPIFDVEWVPSFRVNKGAYFTKKYLDTIKEVSKGCDIFTNACDYDIEGTVIGTNIIKYITAGDVNKETGWDKVRRMHFSTTTRQDLLASFANTESFDARNFDAGETRHVIDWMWGINLSRALMHAMYATGTKKTMSIGRVQGPTLSILSEREKDIKAFKPRDYWKAFITSKGIDFENKKGALFEEETAKAAVSVAEGAKANVDSVDVREAKLFPFPPFDLTSLQLEASRAMGMDPSRTLAIAQALYERSYISYPRTASQKLPLSLNLPRIITMLAANPKYREIAHALISESRFRPIEGKKEDEAHPAIYPTGEQPARLTEEEEKLYDLITRRFLSVFADFAIVEHTNVLLSVGEEKYDAKGSRLVKSGWLSYYPYYKPQEASMPKFDANTQVDVEKSFLKKLITQPPDRYGKASLIALLESKDLGTKATRSAIVDTLFNRGYITNKRIEVTEYGMSVYEALKTNCPPILDEALTRKLEVDMEDIIRGKANKQQVIEEGKDLIKEIVTMFKKNETQISSGLSKGLEKTNESNVIGKCLKDGGNLVIKRSRIGKQFVACGNWPNCNNTYPLPQGAKIVPTGKVCELCHTPKVKVFRQGKVFEMDLDPSCESKKNWAKPKNAVLIKQPVKASELPKSPVAPAAPSPLLSPSPSLSQSPSPSPLKIQTQVQAPKPAPKPVQKAKAKPKAKAKAKKETKKKEED